MSEAKGKMAKEEDDEVEEYELKKEAPFKSFTRKNDVYINAKTNMKAQFNRCKSLLEKHDEIHLHGLGIAVEKAVSLALELEQECSPVLKLSATTDTLNVVDDMQCLNDETKSEKLNRNVSVIHIKIFKSSDFLTVKTNKRPAEDNYFLNEKKSKKNKK